MTTTSQFTLSESNGLVCIGPKLKQKGVAYTPVFTVTMSRFWAPKRELQIKSNFELTKLWIKISVVLLLNVFSYFRNILYVIEGTLNYCINMWWKWHCVIKNHAKIVSPLRGPDVFHANRGRGHCCQVIIKTRKGPLCVKLKTKKKLAWRNASRPGAV